MMDDESATEHGEDTSIVEQVQSAVDTAENTVPDIAETVVSVASETAEITDHAEHRAAHGFAAASSENAQAFEQTRDRLQQMGMPGLDIGKGMFDQLRQNTDHLSQRLFADYGQNAQDLAEFNAKAVEAWRTNAQAAIAHWQSLAGVTNWSDLVALNTAHARKQIEAMTVQTRELTEIAGRAARQTAAQVRSKG